MSKEVKILVVLVLVCFVGGWFAGQVWHECEVKSVYYQTRDRTPKIGLISKYQDYSYWMIDRDSIYVDGQNVVEWIRSMDSLNGYPLP